MKMTGIKSGVDFENYIQQLFLYDEIQAITTPTTNDYGSDLIIKHRGYTFSAQCKFYTKPVGVKAVQEVMGSLKYYNADYGIVITNSIFTQQAQNLASTNNILLIDGTNSFDSPKQILDDFIGGIRSNRPVATSTSSGWTTDDLVIRYGVSKNTVMKNFLAAGLPYTKVGREYRFSEDEVVAWEITQRRIPYRKDQYITLPAYTAHVKKLHADIKKAKANGNKEKVATLKRELKSNGQSYIEWWVWLILAIIAMVVIGVLSFLILSCIPNLKHSSLFS